MAWILVIKAFCDFSLIFGILNYLFPSMSQAGLNSLVYILISSLTCLIYSLRRSGNRWFYLCLPILIFPFSAVKTAYDIIFSSIICFYALFFIFKSSNVNYVSFIEEFKRGFASGGIIFLISILNKNTDLFDKVSAQYLIIYLISSIVLLRTLRHMEYNKVDKDLNKINIRYSIFVAASSFVISIKAVRELIFTLIYQAYNHIIDVLIYILSWPLLGIGYIVEFIIFFVKKLLKNVSIDETQIQVQKSPFENMKSINRTDIIDFLLKSRFVNILLHVAVTALIVFVLIKILSRYFNSKREEEEYSEAKEFIRLNKPVVRFHDLFKKKEPRDFIRAYYLKYLKVCKAKNIDISMSDTTLEINQKSKAYFDQIIIENIRNIYIKVRYGCLNPDNRTKKEFYSYFKGLTKNR